MGSRPPRRPGVILLSALVSTFLAAYPIHAQHEAPCASCSYVGEIEILTPDVSGTSNKVGTTAANPFPPECPLPGPCAVIPPEKSFEFTYRVRDAFTGATVPNANFNIVHGVEAFSGHHDHDDSRRRSNPDFKGRFVPSSGNTGASGVVTITYTASTIAGVETAVFRCSSPTSPVCGEVYLNVNVIEPGLEFIGAGQGPGDPTANFQREHGPTDFQHVSSHYGKPSFNRALVAQADRYAAQFPGAVLIINDMSLAWGGRLDIQHNWTRPHAEHRFGRNADIRFRTVPGGANGTQGKWLEGDMRLNNLNPARHGEPPDHWHLRWYQE